MELELCVNLRLHRRSCDVTAIELFHTLTFYDVFVS